MSLISVISFIVQDGVSPLYVASESGHTDVVDLLVRAGADLHLTTTEVYMHTYCADHNHTSVYMSINHSIIRTITITICYRRIGGPHNVGNGAALYCDHVHAPPIINSSSIAMCTA